jgi:glucosyl-3-phosphoglycerate synthase
MGDFYQNTNVTTLHNFRNRDLEAIEEALNQYNTKRPIGLIIPLLYSEIGRPALKNMLAVLKDVPYLNEIVIGLDAANEQEFEHAKEYFSVLPQHHRIIWNDGPGMKHFEFKLNEENIHLGNSGKGKNMWFCFGYMIASGKSEAIALHDADIITYDREMLARLIYPVAKPTFNYKYCKGYYFRADDTKINGRMVRLLVTPLLHTLKYIMGPLDYLDYLDSFRYILSSEFSMRSDVMKTIRIPSDWGLEMGILAEVHRNNAVNRICQVEIADRYDHKHQSESFDNPEKGLSKMSFDISRSIFAKLASDGSIFNEGMFRTIKATYHRIALDMVEQYNNDAEMNGFRFDRNKEERLVDQLARNVYQAGISYLNNPNQTPVLPCWKRVISAIPDIQQEFYNIVEQDNRL